MMKVYFAKVSSSFKEDTFFAHMERIEQRRLDAAGKLKIEKAKIRSFSAGLLLQAALCDYLRLPEKETPPFQTLPGQWGKPYLIEYPDIHFNLSHSGEYVCCGVAEQEIGVDIQKHQGKMEKIAERFFTEADNELLDRCKNEEEEKWFFRIWSVRESYIKFTGRGLGQGLDSFAIDWKDKLIYDRGAPAACFEEYTKLEGYSFCACTGEKETEIKWKQMDIC